jgi:hypothetical protein
MSEGKKLTAEECRAKVAECRELAKRASVPAHRVILEHMADTWERICEDMKAQGASAPRTNG